MSMITRGLYCKHEYGSTEYAHTIDSGELLTVIENTEISYVIED